MTAMRRLLGLSALLAIAAAVAGTALRRRRADAAWRSSPAAAFARLRRDELIASEGRP